MFHMADLSYFENNNSTESLDKLYSLINYRADNYKYYYKKFYDSVFNLTQLVKYLMHPMTFNKTIMNSEDKNYVSTFHTESNYVHTDLNNMLLSNQNSLIQQDVKEALLFENLKNTRKNNHLSKYSNLLYFMNYNFPSRMIKKD